jgi:hypothetical protein
MKTMNERLKEAIKQAVQYRAMRNPCDISLGDVPIDYVAQRLTPEQRADFEEHLAGCPACAVTVASLIRFQQSPSKTRGAFVHLSDAMFDHPLAAHSGESFGFCVQEPSEDGLLLATLLQESQESPVQLIFRNWAHGHWVKQGDEVRFVEDEGKSLAYAKVYYCVEDKDDCRTCVEGSVQLLPDESHPDSCVAEVSFGQDFHWLPNHILHFEIQNPS